MKKGELILIAIALVALLLNILLIPGGGVLTVLSLSSLSMIYFYFGFALFNDIPLRKVFKKESYKEVSSARTVGAVGAGMALSMTIIGIMFKFQAWPGSELNLLVGLLGLVVVLIVGLIKCSKNKSEYYTRIFKRAAIFGGLGLILILTPRTSWIDFRYRNYPDYATALKNSIADPNNDELHNKVEEEWQKMYLQRDSE